MRSGTGWSWLRSVLFGLSHYDSPVARYVAALVDQDGCCDVLEIGCGPGALLRRLGTRSAGTVTGIDLSPPLVKMARWRTRSLEVVTVDQGRAEDLPYPPAAFDQVVTVHSAHHWQDLDRGLVEVARVLRPGGELLVVEGGPDGRWGITRDQLNDLGEHLSHAGLEAIQVDLNTVGRGTELCITARRTPADTRDLSTHMSLRTLQSTATTGSTPDTIPRHPAGVATCCTGSPIGDTGLERPASPTRHTPHARHEETS